MDSRQLRYFIAVYQQRNLSRAADQVNVAQSALSHHISNLEAEFATPLFERKPRGVELMRTVLTKYPKLKLSLTESLSGATLMHLMISSVDLALVYNPPSEKELIAEPVLQEQMFCVGTAEVIGKSKAPITFEELTRLPLILLRYGLSSRALLDDPVLLKRLEANAIL